MQRHAEGSVHSAVYAVIFLGSVVAFYHCLSDRVPLPFLVLASHGVLRHLLLACCEHFTKQRRSKAHGPLFECDEITHPHSVQSSPSAVSIGVKVKVKKIDLAGSEGLEGMNVGNIKPLPRWSRCNHAGFLLAELAGAKVKAS